MSSILGYLAHFILKRRLRFSEDSFLDFIRIGAKWWANKASPASQLTQVEEHEERVSEKLVRLENRKINASKRKAILATYRLAKRARYQALRKKPTAAISTEVTPLVSKKGRRLKLRNVLDL